MRVLRCDQCKKDIKDGETYYYKPSNSQINMAGIYDGAFVKSVKLDICTGCFATVKRKLKEICPQLVNDFGEGTSQ